MTNNNRNKFIFSLTFQAIGIWIDFLLPFVQLLISHPYEDFAKVPLFLSKDISIFEEII